MIDPNDHWTAKQFQKHGSPEVSFFRQNMAPAVVPGSPSHPYVCYLTFRFTPRDESGLPPNDVLDLMDRIEELEIPALEKGGLSVHVAVVLQGGVKDFIFYTSDEDRFLERASVIRDAHPEFEIECEVGPDPSWSHYRDLP